MKKALLCLMAATELSCTCYAQDDEPEVKQKWLRHHAGVQINELVRQVFNFTNSNTSPNNNPYLLVYSVNTVKGGWGARIGLGYTYRSFTDDDGVNRKETDINDLRLRVGVEKAFTLSDKWSAGAGLDWLYNTDNDRTKSTTKAFDTTVTITKTDISSMGGGAMAWVRYNISERVVIGTETSFYYVTGDQKQDISITTKSFGQPVTTTVTKTDNKVAEGIFRMPTAIYLLIRF